MYLVHAILMGVCMQRNMIGVVKGNFAKWTKKLHETAQTIISANFAYCRSKVVKRFQWK